jgi:glutamine amidotransferase
MMVAIVDYNMGNLQSVRNAFDKIGSHAEVVSDPDKLKAYDRLILPGVGAFGDAMEHLRANGMDRAIKEYATSGKYLLGICLGLQLLFERSEEFGLYDGLSLIDGEVVYFKPETTKDLKIPHMGWNQVNLKHNPLTKGLKDPYLYFVHSLHIKTHNTNVIGTTVYGEEFASMVNKDNIYGIQPHPEKSHENGLQILKNFIDLK